MDDLTSDLLELGRYRVLENCKVLIPSWPVNMSTSLPPAPKRATSPKFLPPQAQENNNRESQPSRNRNPEERGSAPPRRLRPEEVDVDEFETIDDE